jgi:hypothetical protein
VSDPHYIDGAILLKIGNDELLGLEEFDLVDQLWIYIMNHLPKFVETGRLETYFPDQPILLSFSADPNRTQIELTVKSIKTKIVAVNYEAFLQALLSEADPFFRKMLLLNPSKGAAYKDAIEDIATVQAQLT